jgi:hypothetical protein
MNLSRPFLCADIAELEMIYVTPFQELPEPAEIFKREFAGRSGSWRREPYMLDIWDKSIRRKVFSVRWYTLDDVEVVSFSRGDWEERLLRLAG